MNVCRLHNAKETGTSEISETEIQRDNNEQEYDNNNTNKISDGKGDYDLVFIEIKN